MVIFEDEHGICLWPEELVARVTPAYPDRLRVETQDGLVGYIPGTELLVRPGEGFAAPLYWGCEITAQGPRWKGEKDAPCPQLPQDWLQVSTRLRLNPRRVRRLRLESSDLKVVLDDGSSVSVARAWRSRLLAQLGLSDARHLQPYRESLFTPFLRDYPFELARAPAAVLKAHFGSARQLIYQVIWQALNYRLCGIEAGYSDTHRGFLYNPLAATLSRAGLWEDSCALLYAQILGDLVGTDRLFTYQQLGFQDIFSQYREIGARHPDIILFIEKDSLSKAGIEVARRLGISWIVSGGISHLGSVEYFTAALRQVYPGPVRVIVYGDFDPGGRVAGLSFARHLDRYGAPCVRPPFFLVCPQLFSAEELELFARPLSTKNDRVDDWVATTGGINGQPLGIHADWLQPAERVQEALEALLRSDGFQCVPSVMEPRPA